MLNANGFDLWADGYDQSVGLSDETNTYPFAGYRRVLGEIYRILMETNARAVLDVGCGTGILGARLCAAGIAVTALDFSENMLAIARERMPQARLIRHDFSLGLPESLTGANFDAIVSTYALHHLDHSGKLMLIRRMAACLRPGGRILLGDIAFETAAGREACRLECGDDWDGDELYFSLDELAPHLPGKWHYEQISLCAGLLEITT